MSFEGKSVDIYSISNKDIPSFETLLFFSNVFLFFVLIVVILFNVKKIEKTTEEVQESEENEEEDAEEDEEDDEEVEVEVKVEPVRKLNDDIAFHPSKVGVSDTTLCKFIASLLDDDLESVPGIGAVNAELLVKAEVNTTCQLVAKYLSFKGKNVDAIQMADMFYYWLQMNGVNSFRSTIVAVVGEKANTWVPGVFQMDGYE